MCCVLFVFAPTSMTVDSAKMWYQQLEHTVINILIWTQLFFFYDLISITMTKSYLVTLKVDENKWSKINRLFLRNKVSQKYWISVIFNTTSHSKQHIWYLARNWPIPEHVTVLAALDICHLMLTEVQIGLKLGYFRCWKYSATCWRVTHRERACVVLVSLEIIQTIFFGSL